MNTGQTILTIGALTLLSVTVLLTNRSSLEYGTIISQTELDIYSVSLAESIIEEAAGKAFDHFSASDIAGNGNVITSLSQLTAVESLGAEGDDNYSSKNGFDDFDDYNSWFKTPYRWYPPGAPDTFYIQAQVFYVNAANPDVDAKAKTWHKKMIVKVWPAMVPWEYKEGKKDTRDTVVLSYIQSYWWFR